MIELDIPVEVAKRYVRVCDKFQGKCFGCKGIYCRELHIGKDGKFKNVSLGLSLACELYKGPTAQPKVYIDPVLALQGFVLDAGRELFIDHLINKEGAYVRTYVFKFRKQPIPPHVAQFGYDL